MAYDEQLDSRISDVLTPWGATRKAMFGGTAYMLNGNLMAGVYKDRLLVRLSASEGATALQEPHVTPFDMMSRPMPGWVTVSSEGVVGDGLVSWLERGRKHAESLPHK
jgi:TfoX/Sxy family transcriptional regulator of competence genes